MRVAVDARTAYRKVRRGTGKSLIDLYQSLSSLQPDWSFLMFYEPSHDALSDPFQGCPNITAKPISMRGDRWQLWERCRLPLAARLSGASVLHSPANTAPPIPLVPLVVTIHDLIQVQLAVDSATSRYWRTRIRGAALRASRVLTPSTYTKEQLVMEFGIAAEKVVVNHWAADRACRRVDDAARIADAAARNGVRPGRPYIFGFGAEDPRKNSLRILEAWATLDGPVRAGLDLLLVGFQEPFLEHIRSVARSLAPDGGWSMMPFAEEADIPTLLSGAQMLCYPSLSEGFGLPLLDAFICGTPVITSSTSSLPEVAGNAALLVTPEDVSAIREAIHRLATDAELRESLRQRGYQRRSDFSWDKTAARAATVLSEAAAS